MGSTTRRDSGASVARPAGVRGDAGDSSRGRQALKAGLAGMDYAAQAAYLAPVQRKVASEELPPEAPPDEYSSTVSGDYQPVPHVGLDPVTALEMGQDAWVARKQAMSDKRAAARKSGPAEAKAKLKEVTDWLDARKDELKSLTAAEIQTRLVRGSKVADESFKSIELAAIIQKWVGRNALVLPAKPGGLGTNPDVTPPVTMADIYALLAGLPSNVKQKVEKKDECWSLDVSGLTLKLLEGKLAAQANVSLSGTASFKATYGGVSLTAAVSTSSWQVSLTFPGDTRAPMLPLLSQVVGNAWAGITTMVQKGSDMVMHGKMEQITLKFADEMNAVSKAVSELSALYQHASLGGGVTAGVVAQGPVGYDKAHAGTSVSATVTATF